MADRRLTRARLRPSPRRPLGAALIVVTAMAVAACSGTGASTAPSAAVPSEPPASAAPPSVAPSASAAASTPTGEVQDLALTGIDFAFEGPTSVPAGLTRITLTNEGAEDHQAQLARIADGKTMADITAALAGGDELGALAMLTLSGGPNAITPGSSGTTTSNLTPGAYVFLCFITSADNVPHLAKGMIAPLEVTGTAVEGEPPAGDAAVTLQDFAFVGLDTLTPGPHTVTVTNAGPQPHEATIVKLADGVAATDLLAMFTATEPASGPPPFTSAGGITGVAVGETATMEVDLPAGNYAFICFIPDPATGAPHAALGMIGALTVE